MAEETVSILVRIRQKAVKATLTAMKRGFQKFRKDTVSALSKVNKKAGELAISLGKGLLGAVTAVGVALVAFTVSAINNADAIAKMSQRTGVATETLSELQFAAQQSGASLQDIDLGLKGLSNKLREAQKEGSEAALMFEAMGISTTDVEGNVRGLEEVMDDIADSFSEHQDGATKSAAAMRLFEESGIRLIPFLNNGSEGIAKLRREARALGLTLDKETARAAEDLKDDLNILQSAGRSLGLSIARNILPELGAMVRRLATAAKGGTLLRQSYDEVIKVLAKANAFVTGNEDGLDKLHQQILETEQSITKLRKSQEFLLGVQAKTSASSRRLVQTRIKTAKTLREEIALRSKLQDKLDRGLALRAKREEANRKLAKEEQARRNALLKELEDEKKRREQLAVPTGGGETEEERARKSSIERILAARRQATLSQEEILRDELTKNLEAVKGNQEAELAARQLFEVQLAQLGVSRTEKRAAEEQRQFEAAQRALEERMAMRGEEAALLEIEMARELEAVGMHEEAKNAIREKFAQKHRELRSRERQAQLSNVSTLFGALANLAELGGKKFFGIQKKFAIAQATVSMFAGAAKALELPFPANIAALAKTLLIGKKQIEGIKGTSPGGGGGGGGAAGVGGGGAAPAAPAAPAPTPLAAPAAEQPRQQINFTIQNPLGTPQEIAMFMGQEIAKLQKAGLVDSPPPILNVVS